VFLGIPIGRTGSSWTQIVQMTPGCGLTMDLGEAFETPPGCGAALLPVEPSRVVDADLGGNLEVVLFGGSFLPIGGDPNGALLCAGVVDDGARVESDPSCDVVPVDKPGTVTFSITTAGSWRLAVAGCAVAATGRTCGVWWARVDTAS
jgi:hypothetical protein